MLRNVIYVQIDQLYADLDTTIISQQLKRLSAHLIHI